MILIFDAPTHLGNSTMKRKQAFSISKLLTLNLDLIKNDKNACGKRHVGKSKEHFC